MNRSASPTGSVLDRILATKAAEVAALAPRRRELREVAESAVKARPFAETLRGEVVRVIAEFKRRSPSAGAIATSVDPVDVARAYEAAGASALSVLTDATYFGGSLEDLRQARSATRLPVLRKDFVSDALQIWEARAAGADAVLLIVRMLDDARLREFLALAAELEFAALVEVHDAVELERALAVGAGIIGINNRDLSSFRTDLAVSLSLAHRVPGEVRLVAESGIVSGDDVRRLGEAGVDAVLVGENLMRAPDIRGALGALTSWRRRGRGAQADVHAQAQAKQDG
ncbi:MAG: indole-3-glycerol phosphate synthase TrpC [Longimicrobiales bacterium]